MNSMMGIILAQNEDIQLNELTKSRAVAAVPFGGRYRLIDFILSNMVNSGIINVGVATQYNYSSLMDHIGTGKPWDLARKTDGLFLLPPYIRSEAPASSGGIDVWHGVLTHLRHNQKHQYVVLANGNIACNITFNDVLGFHIERDADITVVYNEAGDSGGALSRNSVYEIDGDGRVIGMENSPENPKTNLAGMDMYVLKRTLLISLIEDAYSRGESDFMKNISPADPTGLKICGYRCDGFVGRIDSVKTYYDNSMLLLDYRVRHELFEGENRIYTKVKDQVPTRYLKGCAVSDSLVADGCVIEGNVEGSIIFRGVRIGRGAEVKNSIVMQNTCIEKGGRVEYAVIDKEGLIREGKSLAGTSERPTILPKRALL